MLILRETPWTGDQGAGSNPVVASIGEHFATVGKVRVRDYDSGGRASSWEVGCEVSCAEMAQNSYRDRQVEGRGRSPPRRLGLRDLYGVEFIQQIHFILHLFHLLLNRLLVNLLASRQLVCRGNQNNG